MVEQRDAATPHRPGRPAPGAADPDQHVVPPGPGRRRARRLVRCRTAPPSTGPAIRRGWTAPARSTPSSRRCARRRTAGTRCGRCAAASCASSCTRWTAPTARDRPYSVTECAYGRARGGAGGRGLVPASRRDADDPLGPRGRSDDDLRVHRRLRRVRPAQVAARRRRPPWPGVDEAVPAGDPAPEPYLATRTVTDHAQRDDAGATSSTGCPAAPRTRSPTTGGSRCPSSKDASRAPRHRPGRSGRPSTSTTVARSPACRSARWVTSGRSSAPSR